MTVIITVLSWVRRLSTPPLCYLSKEPIDVIFGNVQGITDSVGGEIRCERPEALIER